MRSGLVSSVFVAASLALATACSAELSAPTENLERASQPILNGTRDTDSANDAIVAVQGRGSCTGTLFRVSGGKAYVLTAAHCVPASSVLVGSDYSDPDRVYSIESYVEDPRYDRDDPFGAEFDVAVVVLGNTSGLPTPIPITDANDGLAAGQTVRSHGFGSTEGYNLGDNTERFYIDRSIAALNSNYISYNQSDSRGICSGDSGGPVIKDGRVVGVHSSVVNPSGGDSCKGTAFSIRVANRLDFVNAVLNGTSLPGPTACQNCAAGADSTSVCQQKITRCANDPHCSALIDCLDQARNGSQFQQCLTTYPRGLGPYLDVRECTCSDACTSECSESQACLENSKCGIEYTLPTVNNCMESNCCAEADAAAADGEGYLCLTNPNGAGCANNSIFQAFEACMEANCRGRGGSSSGGSSSGGAEEEPIEEEPEPPAERKRTGDEDGGCSTNAPGRAGLAGLIPFALLLGAGVRRRVRKGARAQ